MELAEILDPSLLEGVRQHKNTSIAEIACDCFILFFSTHPCNLPANKLKDCSSSRVLELAQPERNQFIELVIPKKTIQ